LRDCEFCLPINVVLDGVEVDGFIFSAVHGQIRLPIAVQVESPESDSSGDRFLIDGCGYGVSMPKDFTGQAAIDRHELHLVPSVLRGGGADRHAAAGARRPASDVTGEAGGGTPAL